MRPSSVRQAPVPALNSGSSSSTRTAACTASIADPPLARTRPQRRWPRGTLDPARRRCPSDRPRHEPRSPSHDDAVRMRPGQRPGAFHDHETLRCSIQPSSISKNRRQRKTRRGQPPGGDQVKHCDRRQRHPESDRRAVRRPVPARSPTEETQSPQPAPPRSRRAEPESGAIETRPTAPTRCSSPLARTTMPRVVSNKLRPAASSSHRREPLSETAVTGPPSGSMPAPDPARQPLRLR